MKTLLPGTASSPLHPLLPERLFPHPAILGIPEMAQNRCPISINRPTCCNDGGKSVAASSGAPDDIAFHLRKGGHSHALEDWEVLLDFIAWRWNGREPGASYNRHPYRHLQPAFSWKAPGA